MENPSITLHAKERPSFVWTDGFDGVTDVELKALLQLSRDALNSIEAEFESRLISKSSRQAGQIDAYSDRLREGASKIEVQERLDEKAAEHVKAAVQVLTTPQTVRAFMVYRTFLNDVLCQCGPELVLLCAACLGKAKVAALKQEDRISLLDLVKRKKSSYASPILGRLATEYGIRSLYDEQNKKRKHAETTDLTSAGITSELTPAKEARQGGYTAGSTAGSSAGSTRFTGQIKDLIHPSPSTKVPERARTNFQMSTMQTTRQTQFVFSRASIDEIPLFCNLLLVAIQSSLRWRKERELGKSTTDCLTVMIPKDPDQDISISLWVGREEGLRMTDKVTFRRTW